MEPTVAILSSEHVRATLKLTTCLWFDTQAEEAALFYTSIFENARILDINRYGKAGPGPEGSVMIVSFELDGHMFVALNGGPHFTFNESVSLQVHCKTQEEVDYYWHTLSEGGDEAAQQCGWLKDKFGFSWQVVPTTVIEMLKDPDPEKSNRVMKAMLPMKKPDIALAQQAFNHV